MGHLQVSMRNIKAIFEPNVLIPVENWPQNGGF